MNNQILQERVGKERAERILKQIEAAQKTEYGKVVNPYLATLYMDILHSLNEGINTQANFMSSAGNVISKFK